MIRFLVFGGLVLGLLACNDDQESIRPTPDATAGRDAGSPMEMRDAAPRQAVLAVTIGPRALVAGETVVFDAGEHHGEPPSIDLTVTNLGRAPLGLEAVEVEGDFRASPPPLPAVLAPNMQLTFVIAANNLEPGNKRGAVELVTDVALEGAFRLELSALVQPFIRDIATPHQALEEAVTAALADTQVVGATLGIVQGREVVFLGGFGHEERRERIDVDPRETRFRWADLSKALTGVLATRAAAAGTIDLDTRIVGENHDYQPPTHYLPDGCRAEACAEEIPEDRRNVTFRRLLSHTAGIQHIHNGAADPRPSSNLTADPEVNTGIAWTLDYWKNNPLVAIPGDAFHYSSIGYVLAGILLEVAFTGLSFDEIVQREIADVVGMPTLTPDNVWANIPRRSVGYALDDGLVQVVESDVSWQAPAGGYVSTGLDLARFCGALNSDILVSASDRREQLWAAHPPALDYGFGFGFSETSNGLRVSAFGVGQKARSGLRLYPEEELCFVLLTNSHHADAAYLLDVAETVWREGEPNRLCSGLRPNPDGRRGHAYWGLERAELPHALNALEAAGSGVDHIDAFTADQATHYNLISSPGTADQRLLKTDLTEAQFDRLHSALNRAGWRLHQFTTHRRAGRQGIFYDGVWLPGAVEQELHLGLSEAELTAELDRLENRRRRAYSLNATEGNSVRFALFSAAASPEGQIVSVATPEDVIAAVNTPPEAIDAFVSADGPRLIALETGEDRGEWEMQTASSCVDLNVGDGAALDNGQALRQLTAYEDSEGQVRYNAVWTTR